jgi:hypothetical protein
MSDPIELLIALYVGASLYGLVWMFCDTMYDRVWWREYEANHGEETK